MSAQNSPSPWASHLPNGHVPDANGWSANHDGIGSAQYQAIHDANGRVIALVVAESGDDPWAELDTDTNSRLMAAAPDLLAALGQINDAACYSSEEATDTREAVLLHIGELARAAIAKVKGGAA